MHRNRLLRHIRVVSSQPIRPRSEMDKTENSGPVWATRLKKDTDTKSTRVLLLRAVVVIGVATE